MNNPEEKMKSIYSYNYSSVGIYTLLCFLVFFSQIILAQDEDLIDIEVIEIQVVRKGSQRKIKKDEKLIPGESYELKGKVKLKSATGLGAYLFDVELVFGTRSQTKIVEILARGKERNLFAFADRKTLSHKGIPGIVDVNMVFKVPERLKRDNLELFVSIIADLDKKLPEKQRKNNRADLLLFFERGVDLFVKGVGRISGASGRVMTVGKTYELPIRISNNGNVAAKNFEVAIYLTYQDSGRDKFIELGSETLRKTIRAGGTEQFYIKVIPKKVGGGNLYIEIDPKNRLPDLNQENNAKEFLVESYSVEFFVEQRIANLKLWDGTKSLSNPQELQAGKKYTFEVTVSSVLRGLRTPQPLEISVWLANSGSDTSRADKIHTFFDEDGYRNSGINFVKPRFDFTIPTTFENQNKDLFVFVNWLNGFVDDNNTRDNVKLFRRIKITPSLESLPDLNILQSVFNREKLNNRTTLQLVQGKIYEANILIKNDGKLVSGVTDLGAYLSFDKDFSKRNDRQISDNFTKVNGIRSGDRRSLSVLFKIPEDIGIAQEYYLGFMVDPNERIKEGNEINNFVAYPLRVFPAVELVVEDVSVNSDKLMAGKSYLTEMKISNFGGLDAPPIEVDVFISEDSRLSTEDKRINSSMVSIENLKKGEQGRAVTVPITIPDLSESQNFYIIASLNVPDSVEEVNKDNNVAFDRRPFLVEALTPTNPTPTNPTPTNPTPTKFADLSDLSVKNVSFNSINLAADESYELTVELENRSSLDGGNLQVIVYRSLQDNFVKYRKDKIVEKVVDSVPAGSNSTPISLSVSPSSDKGRRFFLFVVLVETEQDVANITVAKPWGPFATQDEFDHQTGTNDDRSKATSVDRIERFAQLTIHSKADIDWFKYKAFPEKTYKIYFARSFQQTLDVEFYSKDGILIQAPQRRYISNSDWNFSYTFGVDDLEIGDNFIRITNQSGSKVGEYSFEIREESVTTSKPEQKLGRAKISQKRAWDILLLLFPDDPRTGEKSETVMKRKFGDWTKLTEKDVLFAQFLASEVIKANQLLSLVEDIYQDSYARPFAGTLFKLVEKHEKIQKKIKKFSDDPIGVILDRIHNFFQDELARQKKELERQLLELVEKAARDMGLPVDQAKKLWGKIEEAKNKIDKTVKTVEEEQKKVLTILNRFQQANTPLMFVSDPEVLKSGVYVSVLTTVRSRFGGTWSLRLKPDEGPDLLPIGNTKLAPMSTLSIPHRHAVDFDKNGNVDLADFDLLAEHFGRSKQDVKFDSRFDLDHDGLINFVDFMIFEDIFKRANSQMRLQH